jgi:hypothetical protein
MESIIAALTAITMIICVGGCSIVIISHIEECKKQIIDEIKRNAK